MTEPSLTLEQAKDHSGKYEYPRVTEDSIKARIKTTEFLYHEQLTICIITMRNGFMVVGKSAPADPRNYVQGVGERYSYEDAFKQLWALEGYLLCERLQG